MKHNIKPIKGFKNLSPRREYTYRWERGQWYEGYDEHWDSKQRVQYSRIYKVKHRNKKNKGTAMDNNMNTNTNTNASVSVNVNKKYLEKTLEVLKSLEYVGDYEELDYDYEENMIDGQHYNCCPVCGCIEPGTYDTCLHEDDCELAKLIKQTEELLK